MLKFFNRLEKTRNFVLLAFSVLMVLSLVMFYQPRDAALGDGLIQVDRSLRAADDRLRSLAAGENVALHDVMITMEQARMDLMLVVEVRNRLLEAYQELTRMQL